MKLKKKEDQNVDASVLLRRGIFREVEGGKDLGGREEEEGGKETGISSFCSMYFRDPHVSAFGDYIWLGSPGGAVSGWPFLQSLLHTLSQNFLP